MATDVNTDSQTEFDKRQVQTCDGCLEEGRNIKAVSYCSACKTYLCSSCHEAHSRLPFTRKHTVLKGEHMPKVQDVRLNFTERITPSERNRFSSTDKLSSQLDKKLTLNGTAPEFNRTISSDGTGPEYGQIGTCPEYGSIGRTAPEFGSTETDRTVPVPYGDKITPTDQICAVHKLERVDQIDIKIPVDKCDCMITDIAVTKTGDILIADSQNGKVKLFSSDGKFLSHLRLTGWARGVCAINATTAVACSPLKVQVDVLDLSDRHAIAERSTVPIRENVWAVAACGEDLAMICGYPPSIVRKVSLNGKIFWSTYSTDRSGQKRFEKLDSITSHLEENGSISIFVTDREKETITVLSGESGDVLKVCAMSGKAPYGIAVDCMGLVYVCCSSTREVVVLSKDLTDPFCLLSNCRSEPTGIAYHPQKHEMIISYRYKDCLDRIILIYSA